MRPIFDYEDYKFALQDILKERRKETKGLSRKLSEHLNVHPSMVSQVLSGAKDFSEEQMLLVTEFLGLPEIESHYLLTLLQRERAGSKKLKDFYEQQKNEIKRKGSLISEKVTKNTSLSDLDKAIFYSHWLYAAVHLLTTLEKKVTFKDICLKFNLEPGRAREILNFLGRLGIVIEKDGFFSSGLVATHLESNSPFLPRHHINWRLKAIEHAHQVTEHELMYTATISVGRDDFKLIREELAQVIQRFVARVKDSPAEDIAQLNLDFFWIQPD